MTKENKREQILLALEQLLPGRRFHEITLEEVAREAQVGKGTIYLYFKDKDALFAEMTFWRLECLRQELEKLISQEEKNEDFDLLFDRILSLIEEFLQRHLSWFGARAELAAHVSRLSPEQCDHGMALRQELTATLAQVLGKALHCPEEQAGSHAHMLLWLVFGRAHARVCGQPAIPDAAALRKFFRRGAGLD